MPVSPSFLPLPLLLFCVLLSTAATASQRFIGEAEPALLVELYTSEGCSSCPPADRWMSDLVDDPRLWQEIVPVALHVDYWDAIGWPDRFARPEFGARQRDYARHGKVASVYTPGFVTGGGEWRGWFNDPRLRLSSRPRAGRLEVEVDGAAFSARYAPVAGEGGRYTLHIARLGFGLSTDVGAGENSGRTLRHDFVVLGHASIDLAPGDGGHAATGSVPVPVVPAGRYALAAWVERDGVPGPLQTVGGWLQE